MTTIKNIINYHCTTALTHLNALSQWLVCRIMQTQSNEALISHKWNVWETSVQAAICHLDTSTLTKLRYYTKLLVRSCFSWGNLTDLGLRGGRPGCPRWLTDRHVDFVALCAYRYTHKYKCTSTNLDSVKTSLLSHADETPGQAPNDSGGENERKSLERFRRLSKVKTSRRVRHFNNSTLFLDLMSSSCLASHSTLLF